LPHSFDGESRPSKLVSQDAGLGLSFFVAGFDGFDGVKTDAVSVETSPKNPNEINE